MVVFGIWQLNFLPCRISDGLSKRDWKALLHAPKMGEIEPVWSELFTCKSVNNLPRAVLLVGRSHLDLSWVVSFLEASSAASKCRSNRPLASGQAETLAQTLALTIRLTLAVSLTLM